MALLFYPLLPSVSNTRMVIMHIFGFVKAISRKQIHIHTGPTKAGVEEVEMRSAHLSQLSASKNNHIASTETGSMDQKPTTI